MKFEKIHIMGILNVTPDSFYNGGKYITIDAALKQTEKMINEGADIIDIGGESTRPGSEPISVEEELKRVIPILKEIKKRFNITISVDTYKPEVVKEAIACGAEIINDVYALRYDYRTTELLKNEKGVMVVLMHMQGTPKTMQINPVYEDVVNEIKNFFKERIDYCVNNGIEKSRLIIDPGIGFGKTTKHNIEIIKRLDELNELEVPLLIGTSRKSFIGKIIGSEENPIDVNERLYGSIATYVISILKGAKILRVHDVKETVHAIKVVQAILGK